jgi:Fic family protein
MEELGFKLRSEANLEALTEEVTKSSEIEGEILNRDQVRSSIARRLGVDIGALTPSERNVEGVVEMMLDATGKYSAPLTCERLFGWHAALFPTGRSGMTKIVVGAWRGDDTGSMQVVSGPIGRERVHYEAPKAALLSDEMKTFVDWFNASQDIDPVLKAAVAHLWFVTIHPFEDGNGRIARAVADMAFARSENSPQRFYSMSAQIRQERKLTTIPWKQRRKPISTSRRGSNGFLTASTAPSTAPRQFLHRFSRKRASGRGTRAKHSMSGSGR